MEDSPARKRVVEEALGNAVADSLRGPERGSAIIEALDHFLFRDIESEAEALDLFAFIADDDIRKLLAISFRGARWHQKVGLVLARPSMHPAHSAQVRSQLIEYGAICETVLRAMLAQNGKKPVPEDFGEVITKCKSAGILTKDGLECAERLRHGRNQVHLFLTQTGRPPRAEREARKAYASLGMVINECRIFKKLPEWRFGQGGSVEPPSTTAKGPN
jgi:hypothetical protein